MSTADETSPDHGSEGEADGPWMPALSRRLTASEARIYAARTGLSAEEAARWLGAGLGPYATERAIADGLDFDRAVERFMAIEKERRAREARETWPELGPELSRQWRTIGFTDLPSIQQWIDCRFGPSGARNWIEAGFNEPDTARTWADAGLGPSGVADMNSIGIATPEVARNLISTELTVDEARAWITSGFTVAEIIAWAQPELDFPHHNPYILCAFTLREADEWRSAGFNPESAALWASTGLSAADATAALAAGRDIADVLRSLPASKVFVWGDLNFAHQIARLDFARSCREHTAFVETVLAADSWQELADLIRDEHRVEFDHMVQDEWDSYRQEFETNALPLTPPAGWLPDGEPGDIEWQWAQQRIDDPSYLQDLGEILELGQVSVQMLTGNFISWEFGAVVRACRIARANGYAFVRNDPLINGWDGPDFPLLESEHGRGRYTEFVLAEEHGVLCCIPAALFAAASRETEAADRLTGESVVSLNDADQLADGNAVLANEIRQLIETLLDTQFRAADGSWDAEEIRNQLEAQGILSPGDPPDNWSPSLAHIAQLEVEVPEDFYEGDGLRSQSWRQYLPREVVALGEEHGGMFGDYFWFELDDKDKLIAALHAAGCSVIDGYRSMTSDEVPEPGPDLYLPTIVHVADDAGHCGHPSTWLKRTDVLHVITAWNPGASRPTLDENRAANDRLRADLRSRGLSPRFAVGFDPRSHHAEESWAVHGLTDEEACSVGQSFDQAAVFRITAQDQTVLSCDGTWRASRGFGDPDTLPAIVTASGERGSVAVSLDDWGDALERERRYAAIAQCTTWGEYFALGDDRSDDEVFEATEEDPSAPPSENEPFDVDLFSTDGGESGFTLGSYLELATDRAINKLPTGSIPDDAVDGYGPWKYVVDSSAVTRAFQRAGYHVIHI